MKGLTPRQRELIAAIEDYRRRHGRQPTIREMAEMLGITSTNGVMDHLRALRRKGVVEWDPKRSRSVRVLSSADEADAWLICDTRSAIGVHALLFWGTRGGCTTNIDAAGRYTEADARAQHRRCPTDVPVPLTLARRFAVLQVPDDAALLGLARAAARDDRAPLAVVGGAA